MFLNVSSSSSVVGISVSLPRWVAVSVGALRSRAARVLGLGRRLGAARASAARLRPSAAAASVRPSGFGAAGSAGDLERLAAGDPLVDERLDAVREVPGECLEQAGRLDHRGLEAPGQPGEQHVAGRDVGERAEVAGVERPGAEQAALDDQRLVGLGEVPQRLGRDHRVARARRRSPSGPPSIGTRSASPASSAARRASVFLKILNSAPAGRSAPAQLGELADLQPAVLGEHGGVGGRELLADLLDDRHLLRPGHVTPLNDEDGAPRARDAPSVFREVASSGGPGPITAALREPATGGLRRRFGGEAGDSTRAGSATDQPAHRRAGCGPGRS